MSDAREPLPEAVAVPAALRIAPAAAEQVQRALHGWLASLSASTRKAYQADLKHLARWLGQPLEEAIVILFAQGRGKAHLLVDGYRASMLRQVAPATINRRLAAIKSLSAYLYRVGAADQILVRGVQHQPYRDTTGPSTDAIGAMLRHLEQWPSPERERLAALILLLVTRGLRIHEALALHMEDIEDDIRGGMWVRITGKGRLEPERLGVGKPAAEAVRAWLRVRGGHRGPVFHRLGTSGPKREYDRAHPDELRSWSYWAASRALQQLAQEAGVESVRAHGLRHTAITTLLETEDLRAVALFARHRSWTVTQMYDDARRDGIADSETIAERIIGAGIDHRATST